MKLIEKQKLYFHQVALSTGFFEFKTFQVSAAARDTILTTLFALLFQDLRAMTEFLMKLCNLAMTRQLHKKYMYNFQLQSNEAIADSSKHINTFGHAGHSVPLLASGHSVLKNLML